MEVSMVELLLLFALSITSWSYVEAGKTVTFTECSTSVTDDNVIGSWTCSIEDNRLVSTVFLEKDCTSSVTIDIEVKKDGNPMNKLAHSVKKVAADIEGQNICSNVQAPDPDDPCSAAKGEHVFEACDISSWFSDMDPGNYEFKAVFKEDNNDVGTTTLGVKVENE